MSRFAGIFLSIKYVHGDLCKHLGIDSSTDHPDRYSNLFLNAYINDRYSNLFLNAYINRRSSRSVLESIPKCLHKSPCACLILKNGLIL